MSKSLRFGNAKEIKALSQEERDDSTFLWIQLVRAFWCISVGFYVNSALPHHHATARPLEGKTQCEQEIEASLPHLIVLSAQE